MRVELKNGITLEFDSTGMVEDFRECEELFEKAERNPNKKANTKNCDTCKCNLYIEDVCLCCIPEVLMLISSLIMETLMLLSFFWSCTASFSSFSFIHFHYFNSLTFKRSLSASCSVPLKNLTFLIATGYFEFPSKSFCFDNSSQTPIIFLKYSFVNIK